MPVLAAIGAQIEFAFFQINVARTFSAGGDDYCFVGIDMLNKGWGKPSASCSQVFPESRERMIAPSTTLGRSCQPKGVPRATPK